MTEQSPPADRPPLAKRPVFWLIIVAVLLLVVVAILAGMAIGGSLGTASDAGATESARPTPTATTPAESTAPATVEPPVADAVTIPAECAAIYTRDWATELAPLVLNPAWTDAPDSGVRWASDDVGVQTMLDGTTQLTCIWANPSGGGDVGITTNVAGLTETQQAETIALLESLGYDCYDELEGRRCVVENETEAGSWGESHFIREGIWIATGWVNSGPDGYTHDLVNKIFA